MPFFVFPWPRVFAENLLSDIATNEEVEPWQIGPVIRPTNQVDCLAADASTVVSQFLSGRLLNKANSVRDHHPPEVRQLLFGLRSERDSHDDQPEPEPTRMPSVHPH
jgi:hypothetical protein